MNLREELIELFMGNLILFLNLRISVIDQRGKPEQVEDDGVERDIVRKFFGEFVTCHSPHHEEKALQGWCLFKVGLSSSKKICFTCFNERFQDI